jgi:hypothetical protein
VLVALAETGAEAETEAEETFAEREDAERAMVEAGVEAVTDSRFSCRSE